MDYPAILGNSSGSRRITENHNTHNHGCRGGSAAAQRCGDGNGRRRRVAGTLIRDRDARDRATANRSDLALRPGAAQRSQVRKAEGNGAPDISASVSGAGRQTFESGHHTGTGSITTGGAILRGAFQIVGEVEQGARADHAGSREHHVVETVVGAGVRRRIGVAGIHTRDAGILGIATDVDVVVNVYRDRRADILLGPG